MTVKTTFRGGGGKDWNGGKDGWAESPDMFEHHYPRVGVTDQGQMHVQFDSSNNGGWSNRDLRDANAYLDRSPKYYKKG